MFTIRPAKEQDYPDLLGIFRALCKSGEYNGQFDKAIYMDFVRKQEAGQSAYLISVAEAVETGKIAGFIRAYHRGDNQTTIHESFRTPDFRNAGINEALYDHALEEAQKHGKTVAFTKLVDCKGAWQFASSIGLTAIGKQTPKSRKEIEADNSARKQAGKKPYKVPRTISREATILFAKPVTSYTLEQVQGDIKTSLRPLYSEELFC